MPGCHGGTVTTPIGDPLAVAPRFLFSSDPRARFRLARLARPGEDLRHRLPRDLQPGQQALLPGQPLGQLRDLLAEAADPFPDRRLPLIKLLDPRTHRRPEVFLWSVPAFLDTRFRLPID